MTDPVTFTTWDALTAVFRARRIELGMSQLDVDHAAGLASGYCAKLEASLTNPSAKNARGIGRESLPLMLGALGLELAHHSAAKRGGKASNAIAITAAATKKMSALGKRGAAIKWARMTDRQRAAHIRKMNLARAERRRKEKAATKRSKQPEVTA